MGDVGNRVAGPVTCSFGPPPAGPARFLRHVGAGWFAVHDGGEPPAGALVLEPVAAWGTWDGVAVLGERHGRTDAVAPLAVLTRTAPAPGHRRAVAAVTAGLAAALDAGAPGLRWWSALDDRGVPGTLSVWDGAAAASAWAWSGRHGEAVERSRREGWLAEALFARFAVLGGDGPPPRDP